VERTLGAPIAFFDVTPLGRILNRFSSDMTTIDEDLSQTISQLVNSIFQCFGAVGAIAGATKGTFLGLLIPILWIYERIQRYFRQSNTAIARLEAVSRSPIYADFSQALTGVSSIRAYGESKRFVHHLEERVDSNTIAGILTQLASQWLAIRLDFIGSLTSFFIAVLAVATLKYNFLPAGFLALGLTYSFQMTQYLKFAVRMVASCEAQFNSVERIKYYIDNIEQEDKNTVGGGTKVPDSWPAEGRIEGQDLQMRYRDGPLVLKGLDFKIAGGEKIGIAGRTGYVRTTPYSFASIPYYSQLFT
jgi:ATP-binding cassette subfamily C (CFTR/MRP) protein 1